MFRAFEREAFRLETLDSYDTPRSRENLRAFLAGEPKPEDYNAAWLETLRAATRRGGRMYRVHVLSRPMTGYLRFELGWGYLTNMTGGEEFFILDTTERPNPLEGVPDFWLFDESTVATMRYDEKGAFLGPDFHTGEKAAEFTGYRDKALSLAEPFPAWWERYGTE